MTLKIPAIISLLLHTSWLCHGRVLGIFGSWTEVPVCHPQQWAVLAWAQKTARGSHHCWAQNSPRGAKTPIAPPEPVQHLIGFGDLSTPILSVEAVLPWIWIAAYSPKEHEHGKTLSVHFPTNTSAALSSKEKMKLCKPGTDEFLSPLCPRNTHRLPPHHRLLYLICFVGGSFSFSFFFISCSSSFLIDLH